LPITKLPISVLWALAVVLVRWLACGVAWLVGQVVDHAQKGAQAAVLDGGARRGAVDGVEDGE